MTLVAVSHSPDEIYTSTNGGLNWLQQSNAPNAYWSAVASSADGTKLIAAPGVGNIYTSTNSGLTWLTNNVSGDWNAVALSADGGELVAETTVNGGGSGKIYISQSTPSPQLNITPTNANLMLSWLVPSTNFGLEESPDLSAGSWLALTNTPVLNLTNLQNQVCLPPTNSSGFFRLVTQ
jgi:hypothetical protein